MKKNICLLFFVPLVILSCRKQNYITGGQVSNPKVNMTTYDYLKGNSMHLFDTLILLIDAAGLKDTINQNGITFFAPTDYAIDNYFLARTLKAQNVNPFAKYTLDTMLQYDLAKVKDSLLMYIVHQPLPFSVLTNSGTVYHSALPGDSVIVSFEYTQNPNLGYSTFVSSEPQVEYFSQLWGTPPLPINAPDLPTNVGVHTLCQTSGIQTTTGMLNVLENGHTLFFYGTNQ
ncbi:fasciclin domain-containing protein [Dinghuibacter silviterrae]|uniref:Fasciclin domain-containing protein n=1 Tax=Dinghuibacter silviterrae TaxID=1539049 RepID=A0A4V3GKJ1_9BACT|nr:fasciclin domain-containing protein [Dinghuibacter silviterrae]TDW95862.1 fasciclin domain-containing protein [Dinghuibacter silviterrae]